MSQIQIKINESFFFFLSLLKPSKGKKKLELKKQTSAINQKEV